MRPAVFCRLRLRLRLQNTAVYLTPILSLNLEHKWGGGQYFYVFKIIDSRLVEVGRSKNPHGTPCFWIHPRGDRLIATQGVQTTQPVPGEPSRFSKPSTVHWYSIMGNRFEHLSEI